MLFRSPLWADLSGYKVVAAPYLIITKPDFRDRAKAFVEGGGTLVLTCRTGVKDPDNNLIFGESIPVGWQELAGVAVEETESLQDADAFSVLGQGDFAGQKGHGGILRDLLRVRDAEVLFRYGDPFYNSYAAVTRRRWGKGAVYYIGCALDQKTTALVLKAALREQGIETVSSEAGVEIVCRGGAGQRIRMVLNHNDRCVEVEGEALPPFGCRVEVR